MKGRVLATARLRLRSAHHDRIEPVWQSMRPHRRCVRIAFWLSPRWHVGYHAGEDTMDIMLYIVACPLFVVSVGGYIFVKLHLRPGDESDIDDYYYEFEEQHPAYARYLKWSKITFTGAIIATLLLFLALVF